MNANGIGWAVKQMGDGRRVGRAGWNGKGMFLFLVADWDLTNVAPIRPRLPFIAMKTAKNEIVPWLCSQSDLLAFDWGLCE